MRDGGRSARCSSIRRSRSAAGIRRTMTRWRRRQRATRRASHDRGRLSRRCRCAGRRRGAAAKQRRTHGIAGAASLIGVVAWRLRVVIARQPARTRSADARAGARRRLQTDSRPRRRAAGGRDDVPTATAHRRRRAASLLNAASRRSTAIATSPSRRSRDSTATATRVRSRRRDRRSGDIDAVRRQAFPAMTPRSASGTDARSVRAATTASATRTAVAARGDDRRATRAEDAARRSRHVTDDTPARVERRSSR